VKGSGESRARRGGSRAPQVDTSRIDQSRRGGRQEQRRAPRSDASR